MKHSLTAAAAALTLMTAVPAMACGQDDCGIVLGTSFGSNCVGVVLQSAVHKDVRTYGVPLGGDTGSLLASTAIKGGPYAIHSGASINCRGTQVPIVIYGSNDPAEQ